MLTGFLNSGVHSFLCQATGWLKDLISLVRLKHMLLRNNLLILKNTHMLPLAPIAQNAYFNKTIQNSAF